MGDAFSVPFILSCLKANHGIIEKKQDDTKDALDKKIKGLDGKIAQKKKIVYLSSLFSSVICYQCNLCLGILIVVLFV